MSLTDLETLDAFYDAALAMVAEGSEELLRVPAPERWSAAGHLHHAETVNRSVIGAIRQIERMGGTVYGDATPASTLALLDAGTLPRGRVRAPEATVPPPDLSLESVQKLLEAGRRRWHSLHADLSRLAALPGTVPHPRLGPLGVSGWIRFAGVHSHHHLEIARETAGV